MHNRSSPNFWAIFCPKYVIVLPKNGACATFLGDFFPQTHPVTLQEIQILPKGAEDKSGDEIKAQFGNAGRHPINPTVIPFRVQPKQEPILRNSFTVNELAK
jgi:hypothetical protein